MTRRGRRWKRTSRRRRRRRRRRRCHPTRRSRPPCWYPTEPQPGVARHHPRREEQHHRGVCHGDLPRESGEGESWQAMAKLLAQRETSIIARETAHGKGPSRVDRGGLLPRLRSRIAREHEPGIGGGETSPHGGEWRRQEWCTRVRSTTSERHQLVLEA